MYPFDRKQNKVVLIFTFIYRNYRNILPYIYGYPVKIAYEVSNMISYYFFHDQFLRNTLFLPSKFLLLLPALFLPLSSFLLFFYLSRHNLFLTNINHCLFSHLGTFNQRHAAIICQKSGESYWQLNNLNVEEQVRTVLTHPFLDLKYFIL